MRCRNCGREIREGIKFCSFCGAENIPAPKQSAVKEDTTDLNTVRETGHSSAKGIIIGALAMLLIIGGGFGIYKAIGGNTDEDVYVEYEEDEEDYESDEDQVYLGSTGYDSYWEDFVFPESSTSYIDEDELVYYDEEEIQRGINEIYARHGYIFSTPSIANYFNSCSWYRPMYTKDEFSESWFNSYEAANIKLLTKYR